MKRHPKSVSIDTMHRSMCASIDLAHRSTERLRGFECPNVQPTASRRLHPRSIAVAVEAPQWPSPSMEAPARAPPSSRVVVFDVPVRALQRGFSFARANAAKQLDAIRAIPGDVKRARKRLRERRRTRKGAAASRRMRAMVHRGNRIGAREDDETTNHLGLCLQLGLAVACEATEDALSRELVASSVEQGERVRCRRVVCDVASQKLADGGEATPSFTFIVDAPEAFAAVRDAWGMDDDVYRKALALDGFGGGDKAWKMSKRGDLKGTIVAAEDETLSTSKMTLRVISQGLASGKSQSWFFCSEDGTLLIKTCDAREKRELLKMLPKYTRYVKENSTASLLPQFYGLYTLKFSGARELSFVVMNYWFASTKHIGKRYDLKGSSHGRSASEREKRKGDAAIYKDNDFDQADAAQTRHAEDICAVLKKDAEFLASCNLIDYSLVYGHYTAQTDFERLEATAAFDEQESQAWHADSRVCTPRANRGGADESPPYTPRSPHDKIFDGVLEDDDGSVPEDEGEEEVEEEEQEEEQEQEDNDEEADEDEALSMSPVDDGSQTATPLKLVVLSNRTNPFCAFFGDVARVNQLRVVNMENGAAFVGLIDVLTPYGVKKKIENFFTGKLLCGRDVSCQPPKRYAARFYAFMKERVFIAK